MEIAARFFWIPPLEPFLPRKHADILACITKEQIPISDYCCRCGSSRPLTYPLKAKPMTDSALANIGQIGAGIEYLVRKNVDVPCCSSCLVLRRVGYVVAFFFCLLGITPSIMLAALDQAAKLQTTLPTEVIVVISLFFLPAIGIGIGYWCSWRSLPVVVYDCGDHLYIEFWSPAYQQLILSLVSIEKPSSPLVSLH